MANNCDTFIKAKELTWRQLTTRLRISFGSLPPPPIPFHVNIFSPNWSWRVQLAIEEQQNNISSEGLGLAVEMAQEDYTTDRLMCQT